MFTAEIKGDLSEMQTSYIRDSALIYSARFFDQVETIRAKLPQFLYVDSFSCTYGTHSKHDWLLQIIQYDTKFHRLVETIVQFAIVDEKEGRFEYLEKPEYLYVGVVKIGGWLEYSEQIYQALVGAAVSVRIDKPIEVPSHEGSGHSLLPSFLLGAYHSNK